MAASPVCRQDAPDEPPTEPEPRMTLYGFLLVAHSYVRWAVVALALALLARTARGWAQGRAFTQVEERLHRAFVGTVDLQFLLGASLYLHESPIVRAFLADPAHAMKVTELRFFGLEHPLVMLVAVGLVHLGRRKSKQGHRMKRTATFTLAAIALVALGMPWPFLPQGRPLFRIAARIDPSAIAESAPASETAAHGCPPVYASRCAPCHGEHGRGDGIVASSLNPRPRDFADAAWQAKRTDAELAALIHDGGARHGLSAVMPSQADLAPAEIDALVKCVRVVGVAP